VCLDVVGQRKREVHGVRRTALEQFKLDRADAACLQHGRIFYARAVEEARRSAGRSCQARACGIARLATLPQGRDDLISSDEEEASMAGVQSRDFDSPDETRTPDKTQVDVVRMGETTVGRFAFEPGWRWSECVKPVAGTESCQARHVGVVHSGRLAVRHEDGTEVELGPGEAYIIEPGHDAWVVGDERFVGFEFESRSAEEYAKS
jgi:uncharacterized cupin superfamily protein